MWKYHVYIQTLGPYQYVGKGTDGSLENRAAGDGWHNIFWNRAYKKYGLHYDIIAHFETEDDAFNFEILKIKELGRYDLKLGMLLNMTDGGESGPGVKPGKLHPGYGMKRDPNISAKAIATRRARNNLKGHKAWNAGKTKDTDYRIASQGNRTNVWNKGIATGIEPVNKGIKYPLITCPHCSKEGASHSMKRWHFDNCKNRPA